MTGAKYNFLFFIINVFLIKPVEYTGEIKNIQICCLESRREVNKWPKRVEEFYSWTQHFPLKYSYIYIYIYLPDYAV
jgi:hypothetical protein